MNDKELSKRINGAIEELYMKAESAFPDMVKPLITWENLVTVAQLNDKVLPFMAFYLDQNEQEKIVGKYCKNLRWTWRWPRRTEMDDNGKLIPDREWDTHYADREKMWERLEKKEITLKQFNAWMAEEAKKYGMQHRCYDAEKIRFNVYDIAPNGNRESFEEYKRLIPLAMALYKDGRIDQDGFSSSLLGPITDKDVSDAFRKNIQCISRCIANGYDENLLSDYIVDSLNPEKIRENLESRRKHREKILDTELRQMCSFYDLWMKNMQGK